MPNVLLTWDDIAALAVQRKETILKNFKTLIACPPADNSLYSNMLKPLLHAFVVFIDCPDYCFVDECPDDILCIQRPRILMSLDVCVTRASGSDAGLYERNCCAYSPSLTRILNCLIKPGNFPSVWRKSIVVPIPISSGSTTKMKGFL